MKTIAAILLLSLIAQGKEKTAVVQAFDAEQQPIKMLIKQVERVLAENKDVTTIKFPDGSFTFHPVLHDAPLSPPKEGRSITTKAGDLDAIRKWLEESKVEGVQIGIDYDLPSSRLFAIEKLLTEHKVRYWMAVGDGPDGEVTLQETDRPLPSAVPK